MKENPLLSHEIPDGWLDAANQRFANQEVPPVGRPFRALTELSKEMRRTIRLDSDAAGFVFEWFKSRSKPGSHAIGALFTGAFFYDACFWPVTIPVFYGQVSFNAFDSLQTMPVKVKETLRNAPIARQVFVQYWVDCFDYALGFDEFTKIATAGDRVSVFVRNGTRS